jgi:hypothetical protein
MGLRIGVVNLEVVRGVAYPGDAAVLGGVRFGYALVHLIGGERSRFSRDRNIKRGTKLSTSSPSRNSVL